MNDDHLRILETLARSSQRRLDQHDAGAPTPAAPGSAARQRDLKARAQRTRARLAAARARRTRAASA